MSFSFVGQVPHSKSIFNRALIIQSYSPFISLEGSYECQDVELMKGALKSLAEGTEIYCGWAGTVFRFICLKASRVPGIHRLKAERALLSRPHQELFRSLKQLGLDGAIDEQGLTLYSEGWKPRADSLEVNCQKSSQFASAVLLNCWQLERPLALTLTGPIVSKSYLDMTLKCLKYFGFEVGIDGREYYIPAHQTPKTRELKVEADMSSAFSISALAGLSGEARISGFSETSWQPDSKFVRIIQGMGVDVSYDNGQLRVSQAKELLPLTYNMIGTPDLFPVLAILCSFASGKSKLFGAPHLKYKESNRIEKVGELLTQVGVGFEVLEDGIVVHGQKNLDVKNCQFKFDPEDDHRLVMAAALLRSRGANITIENPECVKKSYPGFLEIVGYEPS